jgi:hypothetical protein
VKLLKWILISNYDIKGIPDAVVGCFLYLSIFKGKIHSMYIETTVMKTKHVLVELETHPNHKQEIGIITVLCACNRDCRCECKS